MPVIQARRPAAPAQGVAPRPTAGGLDLRLAVLLVVGVHLLCAGASIRYGALNPDEGFYAVATRAVAQGEVPYRDFGFTQPPLLLYVNSLPLRLAGYGLFAQRSINGLWAAIALGLAALWLGRRTRPSWGLVLVLGFSLCAPWMYFIHLGKTYGLTTLLAMLQSAIFLALPGGPRRSCLIGLLGALGIATRLPAAPFFGVLGLAALWPEGRPAGRNLLALLGGGAAGLATALLPAVLADPENARFWMIDFHRVSVANKTWHLAWQEIATLAPAVWLFGAVAVAVVLRHRRAASREVFVFVAAAVALAVNLLAGGVYEEYAVPFLPPLAIVAAAWVHDGLGEARLAVRAALLVALAAVQFGTAPLLLRGDFPERRGTLSSLLTPNAPRYDPALPAELAAARLLLDRALAPDAPLVGTNLILATETHRPVPAELRMGPFAYTGEMSAERAARLHLATRAQLDRWFERPDTTAVVLFHTWDLNYGWSLPSYERTAADAHAHWFAVLRRDYNVVLTAGQFVLLARKPPADPAGAPPKTK